MKWKMTKRGEAAGFAPRVARSGNPPPSCSRLQFDQLASLNDLHEDVPLGRRQLDQVAFLADAHLLVGDLDGGAVVAMGAQRDLLAHGGVSPSHSSGVLKASKMGQALVGPSPLHNAISRCRAPLMSSRARIFASTSASLCAARSLTSWQLIVGSPRKARGSAISLSEKPSVWARRMNGRDARSSGEYWR